MGSAHDCMCDTGIFLDRSPLYLSRQDLSLEPRIRQSTSPVNQFASLSLPPNLWDSGQPTSLPSFYMASGGPNSGPHIWTTSKALYALRPLAPACLLIDLAGPRATDQILQ